MAQILLVSYDLALLQTRQLLLEGRGHRVVSAFDFQKALNHCRQGGFDLFVLGHSILASDKRAMIKTFRAACSAPIVSLLRFDEEHVEEVDYSVEPSPETVLDMVDRILASSSTESDTSH